jgi:YD repeat-containing protein
MKLQVYEVNALVAFCLRLEVLKISLKTPLPNIQIKYQVHVQNKGWMDLKSGGEIVGTIGESLRIEAIKIKLERAPEGYRVRYQAYVEGYGWMDPQQDGEIVGTIGKGLRIKAIKIVSMYYTYDSSGDLVSMNITSTLNSNINGEYCYIRNAQGDIIGLIDKNGTQVVSYLYDSWGKLLSITGTLKDTVGVKNPYRYRGYRYDTETGLYYLQSRYYTLIGAGL